MRSCINPLIIIRRKYTFRAIAWETRSRYFFPNFRCGHGWVESSSSSLFRFSRQIILSGSVVEEPSWMGSSDLELGHQNLPRKLHRSDQELCAQRCLLCSGGRCEDEEGDCLGAW